MCKILSPSVFEIFKFNAYLLLSVEAADNYANEVIWTKLFRSFGANINKYVEDWNMLVISISIEEDETGHSYIEQAVQAFFFSGLDKNSELIQKRQYIEDTLMDLFRQELLFESKTLYPCCSLDLYDANQLVTI
jgi:hypothetical protein